MFDLGELNIQIPEINEPLSMELTISIQDTDISNMYTLWIYPDSPSILETEYETTIEAATLRAQNGENVLLLLNSEQNPNSIEGTYCTDFWCYPMFRAISENMGKEIPVGTLGLLIKDDHPALSKFPTKSYSTPQWWEIVMNSRSTILDDTAIEPIVQTIDNFERNHRLGLIYEVSLKNGGNILVCTSPLHVLAKSGCKEASWLLYSLKQYTSSKEFSPSYKFESNKFKSLFS